MLFWWNFKAYNCLTISGKLKTSSSVINTQSQNTEKESKSLKKYITFITDIQKQG